MEVSSVGLQTAGLTKCNFLCQIMLSDVHAPFTLIKRWLEPAGPSFFRFKGHLGMLIDKRRIVYSRPWSDD